MDTQPLPAGRVDHDALYAAFRHLLIASGRMLRAVEKNSADAHRFTDELAAAAQEGHDLLYPPPLPEAPEGVVVRYAHAVQVGDTVLAAVHKEGDLRVITKALDPWNHQVVVLAFEGNDYQRSCRLMEPLVVRPAQMGAPA